MARQVLGFTRLEQRTGAAKANANFAELYGRANQVAVIAATAAGSFVVPAGHMIENIVITGNNGNAVTGGIKIGTSAGGTQVVTAQAVAANSLNVVPVANITLKLFSKTVDTTLYFDAVTAFASANIDIVVTTTKVF